MSKAIQSVWGLASAWVQSPAEVSFSPIVMNYGDDGFSSAEEAEAAIVVRRAVTFSNLSVNVYANTLSTAATTVYFRKNGANGNQSVIVPASTSGVFTDSTNSDVLASGDAYCISPNTASGGTGSMSIGGANIVANDAAGASVQFCITSDINISLTASTTYYLGVAGLLNNNTVLASAESTIDVAGVWSGLSLHMASNARSSDTVFRVFINGAAGNQTITVGAGGTGNFSDLVNTDTIAAGDKICIRMVAGTGTGAFGLRNIAATFVPSSGRKVPIITQNIAGRVKSGSLSIYAPLGGVVPSTAYVESDVIIKPRFAGKASYLRVTISANAATTSQSFALRVNGASSALSVSIAPGTTGIFSNTSDEVTFTATDNLNYLWTDGTSGGSTIVCASSLIEDTTGSGSSQVIFF